ncbi:MAG: RidA family protein [Pseudomonadota bacterium]
MRSLTPADMAPPFARYAHGIELPDGMRVVRTSGQLAVLPDGSVPESAHDQARLCFQNLALILAEGGMNAGDVCHISAYVTDRAHMQGYMQARDEFVGARPEDRLPSSTLLIVSGFTRPEFKVEIELWAAAP